MPETIDLSTLITALVRRTSHTEACSRKAAATAMIGMPQCSCGLAELHKQAATFVLAMKSKDYNLVAQPTEGES